MCLILIAFKKIPHYPLVILFNRDEAYDRPAEVLHGWKNSNIIAPKDNLKGGSWFGVNRRGAWAGVTTFRTGAPLRQNVRSRGLLVTDYLASLQTPKDYVKKIAGEAKHYNDFNLLCGDQQKI